LYLPLSQPTGDDLGLLGWDVKRETVKSVKRKHHAIAFEAAEGAIGFTVDAPKLGTLGLSVFNSDLRYPREYLCR